MPRPRSHRLPFLATIALLLTTACAGGGRHTLVAVPAPEPGDLGEGPDIIEEVVTPVEAGLLGNAAYDLPLEANSWVEAELEYLVGQRRAVIARWLERGDHYEDFVKSVLRSYGLPTDLYHLAMIESGFIPTARSRVGAMGLWQFMPATGRMEGLRVDSEVDERLDPVRATHAAARHLRSLHRQFNGDWALAAAAYNAGGGRIGRGLQGFAVTNFWDLAVVGDLAEETKHYVPRLYAMTIIARDRERFGFSLPLEERERFAVDSVLIDYPMPLDELASLGGTDSERLAQLNPHLVRRATPAGGYWVWAPAGTGDALQVAYLESDFRRQGGLGSYAVRRGETLGVLAELSGTSPARLRELNPRVNWEKLQPGTRVTLSFAAAQALAARPVENASSGGQRVAASNGAAAKKPAAKQVAKTSAPARTAAAETRYAQHVVKQGETLWSIAQRYDVSVDAIQEANRLSGSTIVSGRSLRIPQKATQPAQVAARSTAGGKSKSETKAAEHVVRTGETLWSIAREYGASVSAIQSANRIGDSVIQPGQKLLIPR